MIQLVVHTSYHVYLYGYLESVRDIRCSRVATHLLGEWYPALLICSIIMVLTVVMSLVVLPSMNHWIKGILHSEHIVVCALALLLLRCIVVVYRSILLIL